MKWQRGRKSALLIDRTAGGGGPSQRPPFRMGGGRRAAGGMSVGGVIVLLLLYGAVQLLGGGGTSTSTSGGGGGVAGGLERTDPEMKEFLAFLIEDTNEVWAKQLAGTRGVSFRPAPMVIFEGTTSTGCGALSARQGPVYCPADEAMYVPPSFYRELRERLGAPGDFAQAIVIAHEMGHHVQWRTGITRDAHARGLKSSSAKRDQSIRQELQADCFAGLWARSTAQRDLLEAGDVEEALRAASAIGDDSLQKGAGRSVDERQFTHGSSAQRVRWFQKGMAASRLEDCDTFAARSL